MFIRFVVSKVDDQSQRRQGLFQAAARLRDHGDISATERDRLEDIGAWFNKHLEKPSSLSISKRPHGRAQAISWFKDTAIDHIAKMREVASILEAHDVGVEAITSQRPGYIVYEDQFQVAAYPFSDTKT